MSILARIDDAFFLWEHGRLEGAFVSALTAVAASARRSFPDRKVGDREAFERFLSEPEAVATGSFESWNHSSPNTRPLDRRQPSRLPLPVLIWPNALFCAKPIAD